MTTQPNTPTPAVTDAADDSHAIHAIHADHASHAARAARRADAVLLVVGLDQGLVLWTLWYFAADGRLLTGSPRIVLPLVFAALAMPIAVYWSVDAIIGRTERILMVLALGLLFGFIGWHQASTSVDPTGREIASPFQGVRLQVVVAAFVAGTMLLHLWVCRGARRYHEYFDLSWHNAIATAFALLFAGATWAVLFAGAGLLRTVNISAVAGLLEEEWFQLPMSTTAIAFGFVTARRWSAMTLALRRAWLTLNAWLLPVALGFGIAWVLAMPFTGYDGGSERTVTSGRLLWFLALAVCFLNAAWQDGHSPAIASRRLRSALRWAWFATIPIALFAAWSIVPRVGQYGWTEDRIWGALVAAMALAYAAGYPAPRAHDPRWMPWVGRINVWVAVVASLLVVALLTPLADARRLAVASQVGRALGNGVEPARFDAAWLRWQAGTYGVEGLRRLAAEGRPGIADAARAELAKTRRYPGGLPAPAPDAAVAAIEAWRTADGAAPVAELQAWFEGAAATGSRPRPAIGRHGWRDEGWPARACLTSGWRCGAWLQDIDGDGQREVMLLLYGQYEGQDELLVYRHEADAFERIATASLPRRESFDAWRGAIETALPEVLAPRLPELQVGEDRIHLAPS